MINGDSVLSLSDKRIRQAANVIMDGNTLVFYNVSPLNVIAFSKKLHDVYEAAKTSGDDYFATRFTLGSADSWTPVHFLEQVTEKMLAESTDNKISEENFDKKFYEAVGVRKNHTYFVYSLDADLLDLRFDQKCVIEEYEDTECPLTETTPLENNYDTGTLIEDSIEDFSDWVLEKNTAQDAPAAQCRALLQQANQTATPAAIQQLKDAAKYFTYSFPVIMSAKNQSNIKDGWGFVTASTFGDRRENVTVEVTVWTACDIEKQLDYYMIKTAATCHNDQLGFVDTWDINYFSKDQPKDNLFGPFFQECIISATIDPSRQTVYSAECSPNTTTGTSSTTTGFKMNFAGDVGLKGDLSKGSVGVSGGVKAGITFEDSTTITIPDIRIEKQTGNTGARWRFYGEDFKPSEWVWKKDHKDSVKSIQKQEATFCTYSIISVPSTSETTTETISIFTSTEIHALMRYFRSGFEVLLGHNALILKGKYTNSNQFKAVVPKPNNAIGNYVMMFKAPEGASNDEIDRLQAKLKQYISDWGDNINIFAIGKNRLDENAKKEFSYIRQIIEKNKNVFTDNNIKGTYNFYIQNVSTSEKVKEFEITF